jgi:hypothetical protein
MTPDRFPSPSRLAQALGAAYLGVVVSGAFFLVAAVVYLLLARTAVL